MTTNNSGEAKAPPSPRARPGASAMMRASSPTTQLIISEVAPLRRTMALSGDAEFSIVLRMPCAMDSTLTITATTPAIPMMAVIEDPMRCGKERRLNSAIETICEIQLKAPAID